MYSLIFKQTRTRCSQMDALVDRGDEGTRPVTACEGSERETHEDSSQSTILTPESKPACFIWPIMTISQKND